MRCSQFLVLAIAAVVICSSTIVVAENVAQSSNYVNNVSPSATNEGRRYLKGSMTTTGLDAADEERIGASTPSFKQLFGLVRLPNFSNAPGIKHIKAVMQKLGAMRIARMRKRRNNRPGTYGF
ncbi:hypothetical protein F441_09398 [Phytophthora nicotianae CJ01A1]|uniref:RxLR effector protein n=6 Tax=Phytophthora nicotianae TaxID=4792 RepID=W2Q621_PHYN3|nr:hypothetical protein PPTG_12362 [Phytophthora nicotianae INRA-310]ETI46142.1 hypothetical protein F443_09446 [Phytophthora nicotianae P1569]ETK86090.1 hypothetical protein L915_09257 [Phytophthora nicotianae]ETO74824.1 hypothetical protein F444_09522 [Phytophthora nicotianae P1976]ETP15957.1 hypothetical protein F441_09398 [Phytophthora nicotianae CJ01A1]ETP44005.1 hypothetical protein F442_09366 [Phytophthora nicotianae P10297]